MKRFKLFSDEATLKEKIQILVSLCALAVAVSGTLLSYNLSHISREEKRNEFKSTMNIIKKSVMTTYSTASVYMKLSLVKLNESRKKKKSYVPMTFSESGMLSDMVLRKDNVMKRTDDIYDLYVALKALEWEVGEYNDQFNTFYNHKESELAEFESNVLLPNLKLIESSCIRVMEILDSIEKKQKVRLVETDTTAVVNKSFAEYLRNSPESAE